MTHWHKRVTDFLAASERLSEWSGAVRVIDGRPFDLRGHPYQRSIYDDSCPRMVIEKAAQMGATEYAISRVLHFAVTNGGRVIYYLPTDNDAGEFSRDRFGPAVKNSPRLSALLKDVNSASLKRIGPGSI